MIQTKKATFPKYPAYKDSGVEWLGKMPVGWTLGKLGTLLKPISIKGQPDLPLLSITRELGVIERNLDEDQGNHNFIPDDLTGYKVIQEGQFGMNKMKAWQGSYGISQFTGIVSPAYYVFDFTSEIDPRFFHFAIRSKNYVAFFGRASDGVRIGQWDLSKSRMKEIPFFIPSPTEQTAIANFLDDKTAKINRAIAQKEQLIALLKERKQIVIQNAVTGKWSMVNGEWSMTPKEKMKDSGVECLPAGQAGIGEIPEHWEVKNLRYAFKFLNHRRSPLSAVERESKQGDYPYYGASGIIDYVDDFIFNEKTILIAEDGANLLSKSTPLAFVAEGKYWVNNHAHILQPKFEGFLYWAELLSLIDYTIYISGAAQPKLSRENLGAVKVIVPPRDEIIQIVSLIKTVTQKFYEAISLQQTQIGKLKEYKATLIDSAVTGKIKVSEL